MSHLLDPVLESGTIERDAFQREAVSAVLQAYETAGRCQVYAPTGSGKTAIAARVWCRLAEPGIFVLVGPTRNVAQASEKFPTYYDEASPATQDASYLQVNSNPDATRDPKRITRFLRQPGPRLLFATDTSLPLVTKALRKLRLQADLFAIDEAHRNTSARASGGRQALWSEEAVINLPARRRLYMTATPRTWSAEADDLVIFSQDDEKKYGPVAYELAFDDAERRGIVLPIVPYFLKSEDETLAQQLMADPDAQQVWDGRSMNYREVVTHVSIWRARTDGLPDPDHPGERYRPRRILVSFNRRTQVKGFVDRHERLMRVLGVDGGMAFAFLGDTPAARREEIHESVSKLLGPDGRLDYAVIAQCGALTESYDLPDLDMAILVTPKHSTVAIQQLIGRITRRPVEAAGKKWASVLTTDLVTDSGDELSDMPIMSVVRALMTLSETLRHQLREGKLQEGSGPSPVRLPVDLGGQQLPDGFFENLRLDFVPIILEPPTFPKFLAHLDEYIAEHGDPLVPQDYACPGDGYRLGHRVAHARTRHTRGEMPQGQIQELDARGFSWRPDRHLFADPRKWQEFVTHFRDYQADHDGDGLVPSDYVHNGYKLGQCVESIRRENRVPLSPEQKAELNDLGFVWRVVHRDPDRFLPHLDSYIAENGNPRVPLGYCCPDCRYKLGQQVSDMRKRTRRLSPERIAELDARGFIWSPATIIKTKVAEALTQAPYVFTSRELKTLTVLPDQVVDRALRKLESSGEAVRCGKRGRADLWRAASVTGSAD
jgi:superfamily II DNA or RNA helicase